MNLPSNKADIFYFIFYLIDKLKGFFNAIWDFLSYQATIGKIEVFGWTITQGFTFEMWALLGGVGLIGLIVFSLF